MRVWIKLTLLAITAFTILLAGCATGTARNPWIGKAAPDFRLQNLDGKAVSLSDFKGKPVLLNFWAVR